MYLSIHDICNIKTATRIPNIQYLCVMYSCIISNIEKRECASEMER